MLTILVAHGVNLDLLGTRETEIYGLESLSAVSRALDQASVEWPNNLATPLFKLTHFQSNCESSYFDEISKVWDGMVLNPGAWTHTSLALGDRLAALNTPFVEVHLSNLHRREDFRQKSFVSRYSVGVVSGFGVDSYLLGLLGLIRKLAT